MNKGIFFTMFLLAFLAAACGVKTVQSENIVFILDAYSGDVKVSTDNGKSWKKAEAGFVLRESYQVRTGSDSFCDIIMPDRGIFRVADNTLVFLSSLKKQLENIQIKKGKIFANLTKKLQTGESFLVETETAVVSVRGTEFMVDTDGDRTVTSVKEGEVKVRKNIELKTGVLDAAEAEKLTEVSVKQNENLELDAKGNRETEKALNEKLASATDADAARKVLAESTKVTGEKVKKIGDTKSIDKEFSEINQPEKLRKIDEEAERIRREKEAAEEKKALEETVKKVQQKAGLKGIADKKVSEEDTTADEDSQSGVADKKAQEIKDKMKSKKEQSGGSSSVSATEQKKNDLRSKLNKAKNKLNQ